MTALEGGREALGRDEEPLGSDNVSPNRPPRGGSGCSGWGSDALAVKGALVRKVVALLGTCLGTAKDVVEVFKELGVARERRFCEGPMGESK